MLTLKFDFQEIIDLNYKNNLGAGGNIIIIDDEYHLIHSSILEVSGKEKQLLKDTVIGLTNFKENQSNFSVTLNNISNSRWIIGIFYNIDQVSNTINTFLLWISIITISIFIIGSILILLLIRQITNLLKRLEKTISKIDKTIHLSYADVNQEIKEIVSLANTYNQLFE